MRIKLEVLVSVYNLILILAKEQRLLFNYNPVLLMFVHFINIIYVRYIYLYITMHSKMVPRFAKFNLVCFCYFSLLENHKFTF